MTTDEMIAITLQYAPPAPTFGIDIRHEAARQMNQECTALGLGNIAACENIGETGYYYTFNYPAGSGWWGKGCAAEMKAIIERLGGLHIKQTGSRIFGGSIYFWIWDEE